MNRLLQEGNFFLQNFVNLDLLLIQLQEKLLLLFRVFNLLSEPLHVQLSLFVLLLSLNIEDFLLELNELSLQLLYLLLLLSEHSLVVVVVLVELLLFLAKVLVESSELGNFCVEFIGLLVKGLNLFG